MGQTKSIDLPDPGTRGTAAAVPSKSRWWLWVLVLGVIALGGWYYRNSRNASSTADAATPGAASKGKGGFGAGNLVVMYIPVFVLMCLGAAMLGVVCVQAMSLLVSAVVGRWAAIGITLAVLFGAPLVSTIVTVIITLISGSTENTHFLNYLFFNVLTPVASIAPVFGNGPAGAGTGMNEFAAQIATLTAWTIAFFAAAWLVFHHKQETG